MILTAEKKTLTQNSKSGMAKLVAPTLYAEEIDWPAGAWCPDGDGNRPVLTLGENHFEFSFATEAAPQNWHAHTGVFEIFLSESRITVEFDAEGEVVTETVDCGCAIIPPEVSHKVTLTGPTFVVQAAAKKGARVAGSKVETKAPA